MVNEKYEIQTFKILQYLREQPGLVVSLSYVLLTICGIFYSWSFYKEFDIAILKLANISDLLTAGISEPAAILAFFGGLLVALFIELIGYYTHDFYYKWKAKPKSFRRTLILTFFYADIRNNYMLIMLIGFCLIYAQIFVSSYAKWQSNHIKQGEGNKVIVFSDALEDSNKERTLLGSTSNFVFTHSHATNQTNVIPIENISKIEIPVQKSKPGHAENAEQ